MQNPMARGPIMRPNLGSDFKEFQMFSFQSLDTLFRCRISSRLRLSDLQGPYMTEHFGTSSFKLGYRYVPTYAELSNYFIGQNSILHGAQMEVEDMFFWVWTYYLL